MTNPGPKEIPGHTVIKGTILGQTAKALRVSIDSIDGSPWEGSQKTYWVPVSQTHSHWESNMDGEDWILVTNWLAKKIGLV